MEINTLKEIMEQPDSWKTVVNYIKDKKDETINFINENGIKNIVFSGCGTSYYLAQSSDAVFKKITTMDSKSFPSSEIFLFPGLVFKGDSTLTVLISRSGTTSETIIAAEFIKNKLKKPTMAVSCYENEQLNNICDMGLISNDGKEKSIVMTKSFTSMLLINQYLSAFVSSDSEFEKELDTLPEKGREVLNRFKDLPEKILGEKYESSSKR